MHLSHKHLCLIERRSSIRANVVYVIHYHARVEVVPRLTEVQQNLIYCAVQRHFLLTLRLREVSIFILLLADRGTVIANHFSHDTIDKRKVVHQGTLDSTISVQGINHLLLVCLEVRNIHIGICYIVLTDIEVKSV